MFLVCLVYLEVLGFLAVLVYLVVVEYLEYLGFPEWQQEQWGRPVLVWVSI